MVGCTFNPINNRDSTPKLTAKINEVTLSGQVAFPESSGTQASIKGRLEPQQFKIKIGNKTATIQPDGTFQISTPATFQFDLIVFKEGNPNPLMRKISTENETSGFIINSKSTSHAIAYDSYIEKSGNEKVDFESFKTFVPENHVTVEEMTKKVEEALKSQQNVNSPDFKISEDPEVKKEKDKVLEEADKNDDQKVTICHIPPGNPGNRHTITISESALQAHLNHGDGVGGCPVEVFDGTAPTASSTPIITTSSTSTTSSSTTTSTSAGATTTSTSTSTTTGTTTTTKPSATFSISGGAAYTNSLSVILNISGVSGTGIIEMSIDDGPFETFNGGKNYTLPAGEGTKTIKVVLRDSTGNISLDLTDTIILDSIPPAGTNTNIIATSTSSVSGNISWTTTEATFGRVEYGTSAGSLTLSSTETGATTTHSISLTGLTASTTYFYKPTSADEAGNRIGTDTFSFMTPMSGQIWERATAAAFSARYGHSSVVFDDGTGLKMWVIGGYGIGVGYKNDVWKSSDGVTWTQATSAAAFSARYWHSSAVFDDGTGLKMWVIAGEDIGSFKNDVWKSSDGITWTQATVAAAFSPRYLHTSLVFDDGTGLKMWVIGGFNGGYLMDIWQTADGVNWTQTSASAAFSARYGHSSVAFDDGTGLNMWVIGGNTGGNKNDVWKSSDGVTWTQATPASAFSVRQSHTSVVFHDGKGLKMWVIAGTNAGGNNNDVWYSQ